MSLLFTLFFVTCEPPPAFAGFEIEATRDYQVGDLPVSLEVTAVNSEGEPVQDFCGTAAITGIPGMEQTPPFSGGKMTLKDVELTGDPITVSAGGKSATMTPDLRRLPGVLSILPPLLAIGVAIAFRQALIALFCGIWLGALFVHDYKPLTALLRTFDTYLPHTITAEGHAAILLFTMALGGMVGIMAKSGGTQALIDVISKRATSRRSGLLTSWAAGLVVFFDDYANCLLVGSTLRPFTDTLKISREKLAYIVDSTAAPIATVALVSTWVGYQLGLFGEALPAENPYDLFLGLLPFSFYSLFTMVFVLFICVSMRDFGPMLAAERRAASGRGVIRPHARPLMDQELTEMKPADGVTPHWATAVLPVASVIVIVFVGLYFSGKSAAEDGAGLREIISAADSYAVLLWASFGGCIVALAAAVGTRSLSFGHAIEAWTGGCKSMVVAVLILIVAWGIGDICQNRLQTGPWVLSQIDPSPHWIPVITFLVCSLIAFATGSSFSTMAIVIPIAAPLAWSIAGQVDPATAETIRFGTLAAILSGAVFGDHCSPISDTTIMSSLSCASDHVDHVRTQAPYAVLCGGVAAVVGFIPAGFGISPWKSLAAGVAILAAVLWLFGRRAA